MENAADAMKALDQMREDIEKTEIPKFEETKREKGVMMNAFMEMISKVEGKKKPEAKQRNRFFRWLWQNYHSNCKYSRVCSENREK